LIPVDATLARDVDVERVLKARVAAKKHEGNEEMTTLTDHALKELFEAWHEGQEALKFHRARSARLLECCGRIADPVMAALRDEVKAEIAIIDQLLSSPVTMQ
jgi:hypothetical protein